MAIKCLAIPALSLVSGILTLIGAHAAAIGQPASLAQNPDSVGNIEPPQALPQATLAELFQPWQIGKANFYQGIVQEVYTGTANYDTAVEEIYSLALGLPDTLLDEPTWGWIDAERLENFRGTNTGIWGLETDCAGECTVPVFSLNLEEFQAIATRTTTTADDDFFALLQAYYPFVIVTDSRPSGWPAFFQLTWDYGGYSLLGEGKHLQLLQQIGEYQQRHIAYGLTSPHTVFAEQVQGMRHRLLRDILVGSDCSGPSQAEIIAELAQILDSQLLNSTEQAAVTQRLAAFQTLTPGIQVNCQEFGQCTCEGG